MTKEEMKNLRDSVGLTQAQLANLVGFSSMYISQLERGSKPLNGRAARLIKETLEKAREWDAITIHNLNAKENSAIAVGRGAIAKTETSSSRQRREVVPEWAQQLQESVATTNALLLKILERMG